jgi:hypothetical protein
VQPDTGFAESIDVDLPTSGLGALALPGERRCGLPTEEAVHVLAEAFAASRLTPLGWLAGSNELAAALAVQRKVENELASIPSRRPLIRPVVVSGLPRAGTAHLHHLLSLSPSLRSAREWEVSSPTASAETGRTGDDRFVRDAIRRGRVRVELLEVVAPRLPELPPISVHSGEGCTQLLHQSLCSLQFLVTFSAPGYAAWLARRELAPVYAFWAAQLSLIGDDQAVRWLGASPFHLYGADALWSATPDATMLFVRRDPVAAFAAFLDVVVSVRQAFADDVEPARVATDWLPVWATMLDRTGAAVEGRGRDAVMIHHDDLMADPSGILGALGDHLDVEFGRPLAVRALSTVLRERVREEPVSLAALGIPRAVVEDALLPGQERLDRTIDRLR